MIPQPFTPAGVQSLLAELDQLSPADLQTQAGLIRSDLRRWASNNFTLTQDQATYLASIDGRFFDYAGGVTAFAVINQLPVSLSVQPKKTFKLIHVSSNVVCTYSTNGFSVTGGVSYEVDYQ